MDTECEKPAPVAGGIPVDRGVIPTDCRGGVLRGLGGNVNDGVGFGRGGASLAGVANKVDEGGLGAKGDDVVGKLNGARDGGPGVVGAGAGNGVTPNAGLGPPTMGKRGGILDSVSSSLTDVLHWSTGALGTKGATVAGGTDLGGRGGVGDANDSNSPTRGVLARGELRIGRVLAPIRGGRLNGEPAGRDGFDTGAGKATRSASLTGEPGGVVGPSSRAGETEVIGGGGGDGEADTGSLGSSAFGVVDRDLADRVGVEGSGTSAGLISS